MTKKMILYHILQITEGLRKYINLKILTNTLDRNKVLIQSVIACLFTSELCEYTDPISSQEYGFSFFMCLHVFLIQIP